MSSGNESGWSLPRGFSASGVHCGIKASAPDLALLVAQAPCVAAGVYTQNLVRAACIDWNRQLTPGERFRAVIVNSGNANACTGERGVVDTRKMAAEVARQLSNADDVVEAEQVLVLSTGVIGVRLPIEKITSGIGPALQSLGDDRSALIRAADAIRTTDRNHKVAAKAWETGGRRFQIVGICKGAGMIGPNLATMLAIIVTDWPLTPTEAELCLHHAADLSFNCITVEGHTSTNDCALLFAPPAEAESAATAGQGGRDRDLFRFQDALDQLCLELALQIPTDGEGASHLIEIRVSGAETAQDADRIARTIALSNLVKTAVAGADPNWGRVVSAAGYAGVPLDPQCLCLRINGWLVFHRGEPTDFEAASVSRAIAESVRTLIEIEVGSGTGDAVHWTSDLTADYVKLNAEYTT